MPLPLQLFFIGLFLFLTVGAINAQDGTVPVNLNLVETGGKVHLTWRMDIGQTCNGTDILRSTDGLNFFSIGDIPGVCGSPSEVVPYSYTDESPVPNHTNYYKLVLGLLGESRTISIEIIDLEENGTQVRPNPMSDSGRIFIDNDRGEVFQLRLFSHHGKLVLSQETRLDYFSIQTQGLPDGAYFFQITNSANGRVNTGKMLVIR